MLLCRKKQTGDSYFVQNQKNGQANERLRDSATGSLQRKIAAPARQPQGPTPSSFTFFSSSEEDNADEEDSLPIAEKFGTPAEMDEDETKLSQVEFNQKYSIRERQLKARARKQERDRIAKQQAQYQY
uniref:Uncharacterized protein n=1 Tax=Ditylenchus dipsaci TaxID=166011 RepID=A0A915ERQ0_9BILA